MDLYGAFLYFMVMCFSRAKFSRCPRQRCGSSAGRKLLHWRGDWGALQLGRWGCEAEKSQQPTSWKMLKDVDSMAATGIVYDSICQGKPGNIRQALCLVVFSRSRWCRKFLWIPWSKSGMKATSMRPSSKLTSDTLALQVFTTWSTWCWWRADGHWNCSSCPLRRVAIWECAKKKCTTRKIMNNPQALIKPTSQDTSTLDTSIGFLHSLHWLPCLYDAYEYRERATPYILVQWLAKFDYFWLVPYL